MNTPCQDEGVSSRTTRGYWKLGAIGCRGASWSKELDDKEPHGALRSVRGSENSRVLDTPARASLICYTVGYAYFKRLSKLLECRKLVPV